ncbi:MAG: oligoendopeptidase F [Clostridia bacterium]|nr:oligoendopeptidase F [Clostridia bacterium]
MSKELKARSEMDPKYQWKLEDIFATPQAFEDELAAVGKMADEIAAGSGHVAEDPKKYIRTYFAVMERIEKLFSYAMMAHDSDGSDGTFTAWLGRVQTVAVNAEAAGSYLTPELLAMPEEQLKALMGEPDMQDYTVFIDEVLRNRAHTLPAEQEQLLAMASDSLSAPHSAFSMLSDVELPFPLVPDEDGGEVRLSHGKYQALLRSRTRGVREAAFKGMHKTYGDFGGTIAALYSGSVKRHVFNARVRHYGSALESALEPDQVPVSVYENLLKEVDEALPTLNRYLEIRKRLLKVDDLHLYDLYVPMIEGVDLPMTYEDACALVLDALKPLGKEYADVLRRAFSEGWIDVYENKAKRSGAYSNGVYGVHPYVLLNFENNLDSASTLAHELGHTMHSYFSDRTQPYPKAGYSLFVAEVASTCNEVLMNRYLQQKYKDQPEMLKYLLNDLLESFRTTVIRQTMFAAFEKKSHEMAERGEALTKESLSEAYLELNKHYYGGACHVDDEIAWEWMRIPHFYRDFYVYKYATSFSAAVTIADRILKEGEPAVQDHLRFLSLGGSVPPIEALKTDGVDMSSPAPVHRAMQVFAETVDQLEKLL